MSESEFSSLRIAYLNAGLSISDDAILSKCLALSKSIAVSPMQMAACWEAFSVNNKVSELTDLSFMSYRTLVLKEYDTAVITRPGLNKRHGLVMVTPDAKRKQSDSSRENQRLNENSSASKRVSFTASKEEQEIIKTPSYDERTGVGKVVTCYRPKKTLKSKERLPLSDKRRCIVSIDFPTNVKKRFRHMFTTLDDRARILDEILNQMADDMITNLGGENIAPLEAVGIPRQDVVTCIGRICNEAHEGRINQTSVLIEGSRHYSNGTRIHLDLTVLNSQKIPYSFFPGQIVAAEGMNVTGRMMIPNRIFFGTPPARMKSSDEELLRYHLDLQEGLPLQILSACGPYTTTDNMDYAPLMDLVEVIRSLRPDVVILMGPFVPISMGQTELQLEDGTKIQVTHEVFFANKISTLLEELYENENDFQTQFVLVPGVDDAVAEWVFPQAPLADSFQSGKMLNIPGAEGIEVKTLGLQHVESAGREGGGPRRIHCVSNPCTIRINETIIGITSNDVFFQISADETNGNLESGSRLSRIAQHMLEQQSYCPLFPPPIGINLDLRNIDFCRMPCKPDLLIVPSKLTCFARPICGSTMVVNPGHLAKGTTGGTYALMEICPFERDLADSSLEGTFDLPDRITIDIKKI